MNFSRVNCIRKLGSLDPNSPLKRAQFLRLAAWFTLALWVLTAALSLLFSHLSQLDLWRGLGLAGLFSWQSVLGALGGLVVGLIVAWMVMYWRPLEAIVERLSGLLDWETLTAQDYVIISLLAALGEEPLFRGVIQPLAGLVPTAVLFGLLHATSVAHIVLAFLLGLGLGWLYQWSGSLWPPILAHLMIDLATGLLLAHKLASGARSDQGE